MSDEEDSIREFYDAALPAASAMSVTAEQLVQLLIEIDEIALQVYTASAEKKDGLTSINGVIYRYGVPVYPTTVRYKRT